MRSSLVQPQEQSELRRKQTITHKESITYMNRNLGHVHCLIRFEYTCFTM